MVRRFAGLEELSRAAADEVVRGVREGLAARGRCALVLSGGTTPRRLYQLLAAAPYLGRVDWTRVEVFFADERAVPPDDPGSNHRLAAEALLRPAGVPEARVHRIRAEEGPEAAARAYQAEIARVLGAAPPTFDVALLGMGADGHVASLFPGSAALDERERWVVAAEGPPPHPGRVTLTAPVLCAAHRLLVLVAGQAKAAALAAALEGPWDPRRVPAQLLRVAGERVAWLVDEAAASRLAGVAPQGPGGAA